MRKRNPQYELMRKRIIRLEEINEILFEHLSDRDVVRVERILEERGL
jgi:hypothetical protein